MFFAVADARAPPLPRTPQIPQGFWDPSYVPGAGWTQINVPGNFELQGFDIPRYARGPLANARLGPRLLIVLTPGPCAFPFLLFLLPALCPSSTRYRNIGYTFSPVDPPNVPHDDNPTGCYRLSFALPTTWGNRPVFIEVHTRAPGARRPPTVLKHDAGVRSVSRAV